MKIKKTAIALVLVPAMVITGCARDNSADIAQERVMVQQDQTMKKSYEEAKTQGFTGSQADWEKIIELHQTNPQAAADQASTFGMSNMIFAGLAGAALGALAAHSFSNTKDKERRVSGGSTYVAPANRPSYSRNTTTTSRSTGTVSRGGFGGAVSSGG